MSFSKNKILITGGSGMVGSAFKKLLPNAEYITKEQLHNFSYIIKDKYVIHLAAKVGGVKANTDFISDFYTYNSEINQKVLDMLGWEELKKLFLYYLPVFTLMLRM